MFSVIDSLIGEYTARWKDSHVEQTGMPVGNFEFNP